MVNGLRYGLPIDELAKVLSVHQRTIARDLEALAAAGFPIRVNDTEEGPRVVLSARVKELAS